MGFFSRVGTKIASYFRKPTERRTPSSPTTITSKPSTPSPPSPPPRFDFNKGTTENTSPEIFGTGGSVSRIGSGGGGGGGGTYNTSTGVYTAPTGESYSTRTPPPSARLIQPGKVTIPSEYTKKREESPNKSTIKGLMPSAPSNITAYSLGSRGFAPSVVSDAPPSTSQALSIGTQVQNQSQFLSSVGFEQTEKGREGFVSNKISQSRQSKGEVTQGFWNVVDMVKDIIEPTIETGRRGKQIFGDIAEPTKKELEQTYGKPEGVGVTKWLATSIPSGIGSATTKGLNTLGYNKVTFDTSMASDIFTPTKDAFKGGVNILTSGVSKFAEPFNVRTPTTNYQYSKFTPSKKKNISFIEPSYGTIQNPSTATFGSGAGKENKIVNTFQTQSLVTTGKLLPEYIKPKISGKPITITSTQIGGAVTTGITFGQYFVPYYGEGLIFGGAVESSIGGPLGGPKSVKQYASEDPFGATFAVGYGALRVTPFIRGEIASFGRNELKVKQGEFPSAPTSTQLSLFRKNIFEEVGPEPVSFHTASSKFWDTNINTFQTGASELPGLYTSTQISTPFSRIAGSSSQPSIQIIPKLSDFKNLFSRPGIAGLQPKGFREVPIDFSKTRLFEGQKKTIQGYAYFKEEPKPGYLDIPKNFKTEIESIGRPGSEGEGYSLVNADYYVKIKGVKVPVDIFKYSGETGSAGGESVAVVGNIKLKGGSSSYNLPPSSAVYNPIRLPAGFGGSSKTPSSSIKTSSSINLPSSNIKISSTLKPSYLPSGRPSSRPPRGPSSRINPPSSSRFFGGSSIRIPGSSAGGSSIPPRFPPFRGPPIFNLGRGRTKTKRTTSKKKYKAPRRTPSLFAIGTGLKSSGKGLVEGSGLTVRPIIVKKKKRKMKGGRKK